MKTKDIKKALLRKRKKEILTAKDFLSTGSTQLNLACTGFPERGFAKGRYYFIVGDSTSGKTWLTLTCLAEAAKNPYFKGYRFIYDNAEDGVLMDIEKFFGTKVAEKLEPPRIYKGESVFSANIEDFYFNMDDAIKAGEPFIYILDSMDSLSSEAEGIKFDSNKKASRAGRYSKGSYGDGKAKINSSMLRRVIGKSLKKSGSILIVINQTRAKMNALPFESPKTYSGGHALKFYACLQMISSVAGQITKTVKGKKRQIGVNCKIRVKKNRITGRDRTVIIPIYHSYGIDDVGSCIDFLLDEGHWKKGKEIKAKGLDIKGSKRKLIRLIEKKGLQKDLHDIVGDVWNEIEDACILKREKRYE